MGDSCGCGKRADGYFRRVSAHLAHPLELENGKIFVGFQHIFRALP